jgi:hypothetical protein
MHRSVWEHATIALGFERYTPRRVLGFGVGREPLPRYFSRRGAVVVATDQSPQDATKLWPEQYGGPTQVVGFRECDMRAIPPDLKKGWFDFTWSCCALEHLGSLSAGADFFVEQMQCLRPGGWAFHTTEFNTTSNEGTLTEGDVVVYRRRDIEALVERLGGAGYEVQTPAWDLVAECDPPKVEVPHMTFSLGGYGLTSFLIAARRPA